MEPEGSLLHLKVPATCRSIHFMPQHRTSWRSILILSSHLCIGLPSGLFPSGFPTKTLYKPVLSPIHAIFPTYLIVLNLITRAILGEGYRSLSSSLCSFLHSPVTSSLLGPNILLNTLFPNTLSLRSSLNVSDQVSHSHKTTGKIIVPYILIFIFLDNKHSYLTLGDNVMMTELLVVVSKRTLYIVRGRCCTCCVLEQNSF